MTGTYREGIFSWKKWTYFASGSLGSNDYLQPRNIVVGNMTWILTNFEHLFCHIIEYAPTLHDHDAGRDLVGPVSLCELLYGQGPETMNSHGGHGHISATRNFGHGIQTERLCGCPMAISAPRRGTPQRAKCNGRETRSGADGEFCGFVDQPPDRCDATKYAWVNWRRDCPAEVRSREVGQKRYGRQGLHLQDLSWNTCLLLEVDSRSRALEYMLVVGEDEGGG
jgi:hypothetical protein